MLKMALAACAVLSLSTTGALAQHAAARAVLGACKPDIKQILRRGAARQRPHQGLHEGASSRTLGTVQGGALSGLAEQMNASAQVDQRQE
jgi:hypothetical protein